MIYGIIFHRYYTKHKLRKSMETRDNARSELYLAHLRSQSAPNTGVPMSARDGGWNPLYSARFPPGGSKEDIKMDAYSAAEEGKSENVRYIPAQSPPPKLFVLQAPPVRSTPRVQQIKTFGSPQQSYSAGSSSPSDEAQPGVIACPPPAILAVPVTPLYRPSIVEMHAAPGEQVYDVVPIPGAYSSTVPNSNAAPPQQRY